MAREVNLRSQLYTDDEAQDRPHYKSKTVPVTPQKHKYSAILFCKKH